MQSPFVICTERKRERKWVHLVSDDELNVAEGERVGCKKNRFIIRCQISMTALSKQPSFTKENKKLLAT